MIEVYCFLCKVALIKNNVLLLYNLQTLKNVLIEMLVEYFKSYNRISSIN